MSNYVIAHIRTLVPVVVGYAATWVATNLGIVISTETSASATLAVAGVLTAGYYVLARFLGRRWPVLERLLGASATPTY